MESKQNPDDLTPEERLFKIIQDAEKPTDKEDTLVFSTLSEGSFAGAAKTGTTQLLESESSPVPPADVHAKKASRAIDAYRRVTESKAFQRYWSLRGANQALGVLLGVLALYAVAMPVLFRKSAAEEFMAKASAGGASPQLVQEVLSTPSQPVLSRDVFRPWTPDVAGTLAQATVQAGADHVSGRIAGFKLSGIYVGDDPEALIEVADEKKTYAVKKGSVLRSLTVKEVREDAVVFTDAGGAEHLLR